MKKIIILLFSLYFLTSSFALANTSKCELDLDNFTKYKSNLIKCYDNENLELKEKISKKIDKLSKEKTDFLSNDFLKNEKFIVKDKLVLSNKFNNYLSSIIKKNNNDIFGIQNEINKLKIRNNISTKDFEKLINNSLSDFSNSILGNNLNNQNILKAVAAVVAVSTLSESEKKPSKLNFSLSASSSLENAGTTITLTATTKDAVSSETVINIGFGGTATSGTDFTMSSNYITISSGSNTSSTTFTISDDSVYEGDETIILQSSIITGDAVYTSESASINFTITENESAPTVTLTSSASSVAENGSALTLTATLSGATDEAVTIGFSTSGTGTEGTDYATISDITIFAGDTTGTVSFTPTDDSVYEGNETGIIAIDTVSGGGVTENGTQSVTITITDDESAPTVTLTSSASSIAENSGSSLTLTATLSGATSENVTVGISTSGTGTEGTDYGTVSDITITAGSTTGTVSFTPTDDSVYEGNETGIIAIDTVSGGGATENGTQSVTLTITDNESAPTVTLTSSASSIAENAGSSLTLTATLSVATTANVTVGISTSGTGTEGADYATVSDITITAGSTTGTTSFTPTDDSTFEGDETGIIAIDTVTGGSATEDGTQSVTITINEDDSGPAFSISNVTTSNENAANATFTVTMSTTSSATATVDYATSNGTATASSDYTAASGTLTFSPGDTSKTFTVPVLADSIYEGNETVTITLSSAVNATISTSTATLTITDDESAPTVTLTSSASSVAENGSALTLTATLSGATDEAVTVGISTSGTGTEGTDYATISDITIAAGDTTGTASFTLSDDSAYEGNETAIIAIDTVSGGSATENGTQTVTITITENDSGPTVTLSTSASSIAENAGSSLTLTATLSASTIADVTVTFSYSGTGTAGGTDYANVSNIVISAGDTTGTASFTPVDDSTFEGDETAIIAIDSVSGGDASEDGTQSVTITISENESGSALSIDDVTTSNENAGNATFTVTMSTASSSTVTVDYATSDGTATASSDYTAASGTLTFSAGQTSKTFNVPVLADTVYESGNETVTITLSNATNASISDSTGVLTITDDDNAPTVTLTSSASSVAENGSDLTLTATLSNATSATVTVGISTSGTGTEGTDYATVSDITISAGATTGTAAFNPTDDSVYEGDETGIIAIDTVSGGGATENSTPQAVTLTISENESAPTVTLTSNVTTIGEKSGSSITFTATASGAADENIIVSLSQSGTATEGTDYAEMSNITINALSTTGTSSLTPTNDTLFENSETAIIDISAVSGDASESGTQRITITITDKELNSGTQKTYSASLASTIQSSAEYTYIEELHADASSNPSPWETMKLHKALGYNDYGSGQEIAIVDSGYNIGGSCDSSNAHLHNELVGKTIDTYGTLDCAGFTGQDYHGTSVASIAAGVKDGSGIMGVASGANLHLSDYTNNGSDNKAVHWKNLTDDAAGAIAQNNSWGYDFTVTAMENYMSSNGVDAATGYGTSVLNWGTAAEVNAYVASLNTFQNNGVIVWALSNDATFTEADLSAGLPEFFTSLKDAWITAVNIDVTGSAGNYSYTKKSAPCGQTAEYCLGADGHNITTAANVNDSGTNWYINNSGTSFVAPQISGALAILANHFPNHSPEKLADRLLATGYNDWVGFGVDGTVTFGNGVVHGYSTDFGHGMMDLYAALQPITTDALGRTLYTTSSNTSNLSNAQSLDRTSLRSSRSFGDAITKALKGKTNYFYDAMGSQFEYNVADHVVLPESNTKPIIVIENEINKLTSANHLNKKLNLANKEYKNVIHKKNITNNNDIQSVFALTLGTSSIPTQSFFNFDQYMFNGITDYNLPFLNKDDLGLSLNSMIEMDKLKLSFSTTTPMKENDDTYLGDQKSILSSLEYDFNENLTLGLLNGFVNERDNFLGLNGSEALSTKGLSNLSKFNSIKLQKNIFDEFSITFTGSYANSSFDGNSNSMIGSADNIESNSFSINFNKANLLKNDNFTFSISQPNRVYSGNLKFRFSELVDENGTVKITEVPVELIPSGRQIDTTLGYTYDFSDDITFSSILSYTNELNHIKDNKDVISSFVGLKYNNLKLGISETNTFEDFNFMIDFKKSF